MLSGVIVKVGVNVGDFCASVVMNGVGVSDRRGVWISVMVEGLGVEVGRRSYWVGSNVEVEGLHPTRINPRIMKMRNHFKGFIYMQ